MKFIATCKMGLESVVAHELSRLGVEKTENDDARVAFYGDFSVMAKACMWLRAAERVLFVLGEFSATSFTELFDKTKDLKLSPYFKRESFIHVNGKSAKSTLFSVSDCQSIVKKAIVENLKAAFSTNKLPENGREIIVEVGILKDKVTIALDACGAGLSRRGYRIHNYDAPIAESLGAGILLLSRYRGSEVLIDPMCGSGTMPIEACMIKMNKAPGINRNFAYQNWSFTDSELKEKTEKAALDALINTDGTKKSGIPIFGCDMSEKAIAISKQHAKNAGVMLNFEVRNVSELSNVLADYDGGIITVNPPYGERMLDKKSAENTYRLMRKSFDELNYSDKWTKNIITSDINFEKVFGKRADKRRNLSNGGKKCTLYSYLKK